MKHKFHLQYCGNLEACRTEARIFLSSAGAEPALVAVVYEGARGFVVDYSSAFSAKGAPPELDGAIAEAQKELVHYLNRRGENRPSGITRPGLGLWLTERDDETVVGFAVT